MKMTRAAGILLMLVVLGSCQLPGTQVRFQNLTASTTFVTIRFAEVVDTAALSPGQETSYFPVAPGQHSFLAQLQDGTWTNGIDFIVTAGHGYTMTLSNGVSPQGIVVSMVTDN
jgi:hypothetical protein